MLNSREKIDKFVYSLEERFSVNNWLYNGIHIWPYLKIVIGVDLIRELESKSWIDKTENMSKLKHCKMYNFFNKIILSIKYFIWFYNIPVKKKYVFVGADHYRADYNGKKWNKFFDLIIDKYDLENQTVCFEVGPSNSIKHPFPKLDIQLEKGLRYYLALQRVKSLFRSSQSTPSLFLKGYDDFFNYLKSIPDAKNIAEKYNIKNLNRQIHEWYYFYKFFNKLLKRINPKKIFVLCYFEKLRLALVAAANKMGIQTYEIQHGPVSILAYMHWDKLPLKGYDMLPRNYWCWNKSSEMVIREWADNNALYKVFTGGYPWLDYWKRHRKELRERKFILYTLACYTNDIHFPPLVLNAIKTSRYPWFIRIHPDWIKAKDDLIMFMKEQNLYDKVNLHDAFEQPLPLLLQDALLHITFFSGSAIEAALLGTYTVFIHSLGSKTFPELIEGNMAEFIDPNEENFENKLQIVIKKVDQLYNKNLIIDQKNEDNIKLALEL